MTLNRNLAEKWGGKINFIGFKKKELKELKLHGSLALPSRDDTAHKKVLNCLCVYEQYL